MSITNCFYANIAIVFKKLPENFQVFQDSFSTGEKKAPLSAFLKENLVGLTGLEPATPTMSRWCSNQLSYSPEEGRTLPMSSFKNKV
jgi:hypothetical protein